MTTTTHPTTTHGVSCRAHAIGCAVENVRDANLSHTAAELVAIGDDYLATGTASCLCGRDAKWATSWVLVGLEVMAEAAANAPSYVVTNEARGVPRYVTTDKAAAVAWAEAAADAEAGARPGYARPHYVVTPWNGAEATAGAVHVYAKAAK